MFASTALPPTAIDLPAVLTDSPRLDYDVVFNQRKQWGGGHQGRRLLFF
jgi:hypothetical protein